MHVVVLVVFCTQNIANIIVSCIYCMEFCSLTIVHNITGHPWASWGSTSGPTATKWPGYKPSCSASAACPTCTYSFKWTKCKSIRSLPSGMLVKKLWNLYGGISSVDEISFYDSGSSRHGHKCCWCRQLGFFAQQSTGMSNLTPILSLSLSLSYTL